MGSKAVMRGIRGFSAGIFGSLNNEKSRNFHSGSSGFVFDFNRQIVECRILVGLLILQGAYIKSDIVQLLRSYRASRMN